MLSTAFSPPPPHPAGKNGDAYLHLYFRSGWAFLTPYLAAYLLYAWLRWPVNPTEVGVEVGSLSLRNVSRSWVPCLLHVYWTLHAIHLILGALTLRVWWKSAISSQAAISRPSSTFNFQLSTLWPLIPWLLLAAIFWIPGLYLEWPSDPWEHLRRINEWEWAHLDTVRAHTAWRKSSYFFAFSLTGSWIGPDQLTGLNLYNTASCLLLCWQYYRLAQVIGISNRISFIFVLLNALVFGNNIFSFYRYYGLSSSVFSQLCAVAFTRVALEALSIAHAKLPAKDHQDQADRSLADRHPLGHSMCASLALLLLTAFNHPQGIGIAGLGLSAVIVWRFIQWRHQALPWLVGGVVATNLLFHLFYAPSSHIEFLQEQGWLNAAYSFNVYAWSSPAAERAWVILGYFGLINLGIGLLLAARKQVVGWLTVMPFVGISSPLFSIPFAQFFVDEPGEILVFHRMFFAIPTGLALVVLFCSLVTYSKQAAPSWLSTPLQKIKHASGNSFFMLLVFMIIYFISGPQQSSRFWHLLVIPPADLMLKPVWNLAVEYEQSTQLNRPRHIITTGISGTVAESMRMGHPVQAGRYNRTEASVISDIQSIALILGRDDLVRTSGAMVMSPFVLSSPLSQTALQSHHWNPQDAALSVAGSAEMQQMLLQRGFQSRAFTSGIVFLPPP